MPRAVGKRPSEYRDIHQGRAPVPVVLQAHADDVNSLDFGGLDENLINDDLAKVWGKGVW